jgi:hypothetical protein
VAVSANQEVVRSGYAAGVIAQRLGRPNVAPMPDRDPRDVDLIAWDRAYAGEWERGWLQAARRNAS